MRIGVDIRCLADGKRTGVEEYTVSLLGELFRLDRDNEYVLFFNAWKNIEPDLAWAAGFPNVTVKKFRIPNKLLNLSLWYFRYPKLDRLLGGVDIFFAPNLNFVAVSRRTRLLVTAHDLSFELFPETFSWYRRLWHFFVNFRGLVRRADRVIAVSQSTADDLARVYGVRPAKITVITSGIGKQYREMSRNDPALIAVKERYRLPYRFILALGTFEPRKNLVALIHAYEALTQTHPVGDKYDLVLAGTNGWMAEPIYQAIRRSPKRHRIHAPGFIRDADKPALYNLASVFAYPSLYEGFGFPPLEALACGTPVIVSHSSSLPEVVGASGILVDPYRPDELRQALASLLADEDLRRTLLGRRMGQLERFTWERAARETLHLFQSLRK